MATVYRVVTLREDGSVIGYDGPFTSPGYAKQVLRNVSKGLGPSNPNGAVRAEIQSLTGEWVGPSTTGFDAETMLEPQMTRPVAVAGWAEAKIAAEIEKSLSRMPPRPTRASTTIKGVHNEHVDPAPRPTRDNPQA